MNLLTIGNIRDFGMVAKGFFAGSLLASILAVGLALIFLLSIGLYVYVALAWSAIAKKLKSKHYWLAWIPIANISLLLSLGGFHWAWVFLILIPIFGWLALFVLTIIATWKIFEKMKYPGWLSLAILIPRVGFIIYLIAIGFVACKSILNVFCNVLLLYT